jgi:SAM-dependent methyltransferase
MEMTRCRICEKSNLETVLRLGCQPVSTHFTTRPCAPVPERDLSLAVCSACGVVQLAEPFPFQMLIPPFDWIVYREPEAHLDSVVNWLLQQDSITPTSRILGLSAKDKTTVERLERLGYTDTRLIDLASDLGADDANANIESVHGLMTEAKARSLVKRIGQFDLVIARHVLEHAQAPLAFLESLKHLLVPGGILLLEVPDCRGNLERQDYCMLWEEHNSYFTPDAISPMLASARLQNLGSTIHFYPFEDVIVVAARRPAHENVVKTDFDSSAAARNLALAKAYGQAFAAWTERQDALFARLTADGRKLAAYGAGHLTCAFLNFHGFAHYFAMVIDDTPAKQGLYLPKAGLPIRPATALDPALISACLMGFGPEVEEKVIAKSANFIAGGGAFYSMFADSKRSIRALL